MCLPQGGLSIRFGSFWFQWNPASTKGGSHAPSPQNHCPEISPCFTWKTTGAYLFRCEDGTRKVHEAAHFLGILAHPNALNINGIKPSRWNDTCLSRTCQNIVMALSSYNVLKFPLMLVECCGPVPWFGDAESETVGSGLIYPQCSSTQLTNNWVRWNACILCLTNR